MSGAEPAFLVSIPFLLKSLHALDRNCGFSGICQGFLANVRVLASDNAPANGRRRLTAVAIRGIERRPTGTIDLQQIG